MPSTAHEALIIVQDSLKRVALKKMAAEMFGDFVKAVVDVDREIIAVQAELHADLEAVLLEDGSPQKSLWGINLYPEAAPDQFVEFDSMINVRPSQSNRSRSVEDPALRSRILAVVKKRISA